MSTNQWTYANDTGAPVKVTVGTRSYVLRPGQTLHVPEGVSVLSSQIGRLTRLEHQRPRARYYAADRCGVMLVVEGARVMIGDDEPPVPAPAFDDGDAQCYDSASDDTSEDA